MREGCVIAVIALVVVGCGGSGGGGRGAVQILEGDAAIEASAQAAVSLSAALAHLVIEPRGSAVTQPLAQSAAAALAGTIARAQRTACPLGGTVDAVCREGRERAVLSVQVANCTVPATSGQANLRLNGRFEATFEISGVCRNPDSIAQAAATIEFRDYREELLAGATVVRVVEASRLTYARILGVTGCSISDGLHRYNGTASYRDADFHWTLRMRDVQASVRSFGRPCDQLSDFAGVLDLTDHRLGTRFVSELDGLRVSQRLDDDDELAIALDGTARIDCVGDVRYDTAERLRTGSSCPERGWLIIRTGGVRAEARFSQDGLRLDVDGDGVVDVESASCDGESVAACI